MNIEILSAIKKGAVWAIIPARSGSKGVKDKNIRQVGGHPLIAWSIAAAKLSEKIGRVIVSTDSELYAGIAMKYGAEAPFLRPAEISGDRSTDLEFMEHAIRWFFENEGELPEFWVHLRCTTPLRDMDVVDKAISLMLSDGDADCLRSAHMERHSPHKWFIDGGDGYYRTLMGNSFDGANGSRQGFPDIYVPDGYVDVLRTEFIVKNDLLHGQKVMAFHSPPAVDLDSPEDLAAIEEQSVSYRTRINEYMDKMEAVQ